MINNITMNTNLNESSLSRIWQHTQGPRPFAIITAFRGSNTMDVNLQKNRTLAADIKNLGYGYFFLEGHWVENQGTEDERDVVEDSIFAIGDIGDDKKFFTDMVSLARQYGQEGVLIKTQDGARVYDGSGKVLFDVGTLKPGQLGPMYSKLRNNKKSNTFVFTENKEDIGWIGRMAGLKSK